MVNINSNKFLLLTSIKVLIVLLILMMGCIGSPNDDSEEKENDDDKSLKDQLNYIDINLPSSSTGKPNGKLAVRVQIPNKDDIRYSDGAPVIIYGEGGFKADGLPNKEIPGLNDMIVITFIYPGGENVVQKTHSDGEYYDYRGKKSIEALRDIILYAAGKLKDSEGKSIADLVEYNILHDNIGFIGFSFGGNIGIAAASVFGESIAQDLKYIIQWETPVSSQIATRDLGRMLFKPLENGGSVQSEYFNPRYISYGQLTLNVNYSDLKYDPQSIYTIFHDGNNDGIYTTINGSHYNYPTPDLNDNNNLELNEDYGLDSYPYSTDDLDGKVVYSRPVTYAMKKNNVFNGSWPSNIASVEEANAFWDIRESVVLYEEALTNIPELEGMFLLSISDHVQSDPHKSHVHQAFDGWTSNGKWFKINPEPKYIIEINSTLGEDGIFIPDVKPNTKPNNWEDTKSYCIPELIKDETYQIAAIHQMADRVHSR